MGSFDTISQASPVGSFGHGSNDPRSTGIKYPSPWWDIATTTLPRSIKDLFSQVAYHVVSNPLVSSAVKKMASYPITEVVVEAPTEPGFDKNTARWEDCLHRVLEIQKTQVELNLDYQTFGNAFASVFLPFVKVVTCASCAAEQRLKSLKFGVEWDFKDFKYYLNCPKCGFSGTVAKVEDRHIRSYRDIKIIRWEPEFVDIDYNPVTGNRRYSYRIPPDVAAKIRQKDEWFLADMPVAFVEAVRVNRPVRLVDANLFHFRAPTPSVSSARGWGFPPILAAMKDSYHLQLVKKANEAILLEHMVPLDIIFPSTTSPNADPYVTTNLASWKRDVEAQINLWRRDSNHKPVMPLPVDVKRIGGDGRSLLAANEMRAMSEQVLVGANVTQEFVFGGLTWTGSSVSLRMLENTFIADRAMHERFLKHFVIPIIAMYMRWTPAKVHMKQFRMADDIQTKQLLMQLKQLGELSSKTLLSEFGKDSDAEQDIIGRENRVRMELQKQQALATADVQADITERQQARLQAAQAQRPQTNEQGVNVIHIAQGWANRLQAMDPAQQQQALSRIDAEMPQMGQVIRSLLSPAPVPGGGAAPEGGQPLPAKVNMKPMPEQRAPRRGGA